MPQRSLNNFATSFLDAVSPSTTQFRIVRAAPGPLDLPLPAGDFFLLTAFRLVNGREVEHEVMRVNEVELTSTGAYTVTVQRAQEHIGSPTTSSAYAYGVGDLLEARATAGTLDGMLQARDNLRTLADPDEALENLGAGVTGAAVLKAGNAAEARQILGVGTGGGEGGGTVDVDSNGALIAGGTVVAPAYLGPRSSSQITAIHAAIAAGTASYPVGSALVADGGQVWTLQGSGTAARFSPPAAIGVSVLPTRSGNSTTLQSEAGSVMPVSGVASVAVASGLTGFFAQVVRYDAAALNITPASGVQLFYGGVRVTSLQVTNKGAWVLIKPGSAADEYFLDANGAGGAITAIAYTQPDAEPPVLVGTVTPSNVQATSATISWPAATDNVGVTGYRYRRNSSASWITIGNVLTGPLNALTASTPYAPEVQARDAAGNWSASIVGEFTTAAPPVSTKPRFLYAAANPTGDATIFDAAWASATELTGSANGGKSGTFQTVADSTVFTWLLVLASAAPSGIRVFDGTGYGGFSGALASGLQAGGDPADPITAHVPYTAADGSFYKAFRSNGRASNSPILTVS
jgi:hypothetical protein